MIAINRSLPGAAVPLEAPSVKIIGVGGAGCTALDRLLLDGVEAADLVAINTDLQSLTASVASQKVQLGNALTHGLGAGGDPEVGMAAAEAVLPQIHEVLEGAKIVFVIAGLGGGTGSGATPYIVHAAREDGALVIGVVTLPFAFEGRRRAAQARTALDQLRQLCHAVICFENDRMSELIAPKTGIQQAFLAADQTISECVRSVLSMIARPGVLKVGLDDLLSALQGGDTRCLFGHGEAEGDNRAHEALARALKNPLMERGRLLDGAANVLVYVAGSSNLTLAEVEILMSDLNRHINDQTLLLLGSSIDPRLGNRLTVTLLSSLGNPEALRPVPALETSLPLTGRTHPVEVILDAPAEPVLLEEMPPANDAADTVQVPPAVKETAPPSRTLPARTAPQPLRPRPVRTAAEQPAPAEKSPQVRQETLQFEPVSRGRFEKSEPTVVDGHDLDVPTVLRKGYRL